MFIVSLCTIFKNKIILYRPNNVLNKIKSISYLNYTLELILEGDTVPKHGWKGL